MKCSTFNLINLFLEFHIKSLKFNTDEYINKLNDVLKGSFI